jgi:hypothetical protein
MTKRKTFLPLLLTAALFVSATVSCNKDDDDKPVSNKYNITGSANGAQEVPAVTTNGTATISSVYDADANTLGYTITWMNLTDVVNNMHFHGPADATVSAPVAIPITGWAAAKAGTISGTATLTETQEAELLSGKWYYNIHTPFKGGGEIRGNLTATRQ